MSNSTSDTNLKEGSICLNLDKNGESGIQEIDVSDINIIEVIGKGSFGVVHKGYWRNRLVAIKVVETETELAAFSNEVSQLSRLNHENIIQMFGVISTSFEKCLVMEYADGGSLYEFLHSPPYSKYKFSHAISWLLQCAKAISYLHAHRPVPIIHRDLKPLNMLLMKGKQILKICDFGTACDLHSIMSGNRGSTAWMAPEVVRSTDYNEKCDVYSWGLIMWEVFTRRIPFEEWGHACRIMWKVVNKVRPPLIQGCPKPLEVLMKNCWLDNFSLRPSMQYVVDTLIPFYQVIYGGDDPISNSSSSGESFTESYFSHIGDSSTCQDTSHDVSEFTSSGNTLDNHYQDVKTLPSEQDLKSDIETIDSNPDKFTEFAIETPDVPRFKMSSNRLPPNVIPQDEVFSQWNFDSNIGNVLNNPLEPNKFDRPYINDNVQSIQSSAVKFPLINRPDVSLNNQNFNCRFSPSMSSSYMKPISIDIPNSSQLDRRDAVYAKEANDFGIPSLSMPVNDGSKSEEGVPNVPMRNLLHSQSPSAAMRRRSAEVPKNFGERTKFGHRRTSSSGSSGLIGFEPLVNEVFNQNEPKSCLDGGPSSLPHFPERETFVYSSLNPEYNEDFYNRDIFIPNSTHLQSQVLPHNINQSPRDPIMPHYHYSSHSRTPPYSQVPTPHSHQIPNYPSSHNVPKLSNIPKDLPGFPHFLHSPSKNSNPMKQQMGGEAIHHTLSSGAHVPAGDSNEVEDNLGDAFWELLDPNIRPGKVVPNCPQSQNIFKEHKDLARKLLTVQEELVYLENAKSELLTKLKDQDKEKSTCIQRYDTKTNQLKQKNESFWQTQAELTKQLHEIRSRKSEFRKPEVSPRSAYNQPTNQQPPHQLHYQQQHQQPASLPSPLRQNYFNVQHPCFEPQRPDCIDLKLSYPNNSNDLIPQRNYRNDSSMHPL